MPHRSLIFYGLSGNDALWLSVSLVTGTQSSSSVTWYYNKTIDLNFGNDNYLNLKRDLIISVHIVTVNLWGRLSRIAGLFLFLIFHIMMIIIFHEWITILHNRNCFFGSVLWRQSETFFFCLSDILGRNLQIALIALLGNNLIRRRWFHKAYFGMCHQNTHPPAYLLVNMYLWIWSK